MKRAAAFTAPILLVCELGCSAADLANEPLDAGAAGPLDDASRAADGSATSPDATSSPREEAGSDDGNTGPDAGSADAQGALVLTSTGFLEDGGDRIFPASASSPQNQSPPFSWSGAPKATQSFALTFVDDSNGATKWVIWDIPAATTSLPGNIPEAAHPPEVPGATQLGSLGHVGYAGPGVPGPPYHTYEFVLWALDVPTLPGTSGLTTAQIRQSVLPSHRIVASAPFVAKGQAGGP